LLILKSLTKPFGIGGLRAGYAVSSGGVIKRLRTMMLPWNVASIVQRIIPALFQQYQYFSESWRQIIEERDTMSESLERSGLLVRKNRTPFLLAKVRDAERVRKHLLVNHHIAVRSCGSFGMPEWIRIMPGRPEQNFYLLEKLKDELLINSSFCRP
jgi:histidinol-phosphate/aromatic aminotransferase/cobyric acid decarboxylase-like protein